MKISEEKESEGKTIELLDIDEQNEDVQKIKNVLRTRPIKLSKCKLVLILVIPIIFILILAFYLNIRKLSLPKNMKLLLVEDCNQLNQVAGDLILNLIKSRPNATISLGTGSIPKGIYKYLIDKYEDKKISFANVHILSNTEFCGLNYYDIQSYEHYLRINFLDHVDIKEKNVHLLKGSASSCQKNADVYNKLLKGMPKIDLQLVRLDEDGLFGHNEPGTSFKTETHVVCLNTKEREKKAKLFENNIEITPSCVVTQGIKNVLDSKNVIVVAKGKSKAKSLRSLFSGQSTRDIPITALLKHKGNVYVVADKEASSLL